MICLFEQYELLPTNVQEVIEKINEDCDYSELEEIQEELETIGFTFDYYLDCVAFNLVSCKFHDFLSNGLLENKLISINGESDVEQILLDGEFIDENGNKIEITVDMLLGK